MKKSTLYFRHDFNARSDAKMQAVLAELGCAGIGAYWCIIEQLYENDGLLPISLCNCIAIGLGMSVEAIQRLLTGFGLFDNDGESFWSPSILERLGEHKDYVEKRRSNALKRWHPEQYEQKADYPTEMQSDATASNCNTINNNNNNNNKNNISISPNGDSAKRKAFVPPTTEEVNQYMLEKGIVNVDAQRFVDFYESKGWLVGKAKMKDWKAAVRNWSRDNSRNRTTTTRPDNKHNINAIWELET